MAENNTKEIISELKAIREDLGYLKEHMVDIDTILAEDDKLALEQARKEFKEGKTKPLDRLKKELDL